jgi:hypothetical protein
MHPLGSPQILVVRYSVRFVNDALGFVCSAVIELGQAVKAAMPAALQSKN